MQIESCTCVDCKESCATINFDNAYPDDGYTIELKVDTMILNLIWVIVAVAAAFLIIVILSYIFRKFLLLIFFMVISLSVAEFSG